jgi:glucose/arabinose dehydrogenase
VWHGRPARVYGATNTGRFARATSMHLHSRHMRAILDAILLIFVFAPTVLADAPPALRLEELARGLKQPVFLTHDGTPRRFIVEQAGTIRLVNADGKVPKTPYLDIVKRVNSGAECGLLSVAFHPKFAKNGFLFVDYTAKKGRQLQTIIARFTAEPDAATVDPSTELILLTIDQPYPNHNGGQLQFGPDGMLYIGMGDGGSANDPQGNGQNSNVLLGKILRLDVNPSGDAPYTVPKNNPFVNRSAYRPEIWALGLRNPWRFSFDRETGDCYAGDIGQNLYEEIDLITRGGNYGWRDREASHAFNGGEMKKEFSDPLVEYGRDKGQSITGGYVYRGKLFPQLVGWYLYADYASGRFFAMKQKKGKSVANVELTVTFTDKAGQERPTLNRVQTASFGEDVDGEIYVCDHNGVVYRVVAK